MRIIGGAFRGRKLITPNSRDIRPTTGRLRESIFSALEHRIDRFNGKRVADFFAGTGAFGLECLSRGAGFVTFIEKSPASVKILQENIDAFGVDEKTGIARLDARNLPKAESPFDVVFMDPPYGKGLLVPALKEVVEKKWVGPGGLILFECEKGESNEIPLALEEVKTLAQGNRKVVFLVMK